MSTLVDARVAAAVAHWGPRFIANGVDYNDFVRTTAAVGRWEEWLDAWTATAEAHEAIAVEARAQKHPRSAGEAFLRAAVSHHFGKFVWVLDVERNRQATRAAVRALYEAHALLDPSAERIEAPIDGGRIVANLRRPSGATAPLVVLIPGLDSTKEEFYAWESVFLERGMATLSLDGPGQGETGFSIDISPRYERAVSAALDAVSACGELDLERIGAAGVSLGGLYAARSAAFEPRIRAVACVSGPYDMGAGWESLPALTREALQHHSGAQNEAQARERAGRLNLAGVAERIEQPCLVVAGKRDRVISWEQTRRIAEEAPRAEWVLYAEGTHVCNNIPYRYRPLVADWLADRLQ